MFFKICYSFVLLVFFLSNINFSQENSQKSERWVKIDNDLIYNIVIVSDKNQNITKGFLYGMKGDSLYLTTRDNMISLNLKNLLTVSIENRKTNYHATVLGTISGMYLGTFLFLTTKNQPAKYLEYDGTLGLALYELLFISAGGGLGYLIDRTGGDDQVVFYFNQGEDGIEKEINKLKDYLAASPVSKKIKVNINFSQVKTRLSEFQDNSGENYYWNGYYDQNYNEIHSFNMLRKISVTYELFEKLELGVALGWYGEPDVNLNKYEYNYGSSNVSSHITQSYNGLGYYLIAQYKPIKNITPDNLDLIIGAGIGIGKVDFQFKSETETRNYPSDPIVEIDEKEIIKLVFSSLFAAEIKYLIYPWLSLSLQADYIYIPEKMPAIQELGLGERSLGNLSYGMGIGLNF